MMKKRPLILLIALVSVAWVTWGCGPAATPSPPASLRAALERIRPQVFHQPHNSSEQEVTASPTTAGDGDRVRIPGLGKALLKWPDLHVMLYRETEMETKNVTPTWIRLGILAGTIAAGGNLEPDQRLACDTDGAEITMPGTTVMVAYHPDTGLTILRVFDGWAQVRNLEGEQRVESVNAGEWALVAPGEAPMVSDDLMAMRGLALELDLWDVFSEVEQEVAGGFGPAPVPRDEVEIVFEEEPEPPIDAQEVEFSCWPEHIVIEPGECTILGWDTRYVEAVHLDGEEVAAQDEREVCPSESHVFELAIDTGVGVEYCRMAVEMPERPPPVEEPEPQPPIEEPEPQPPVEEPDTQPPAITNVRVKPLSPSQERFEGYPSCNDRLWVEWRVGDPSGVRTVSVIPGKGGAITIQPTGGLYRHPAALQDAFTITAEDAYGNRATLPIKVSDVTAPLLAEAGYPDRLCIPLVFRREAEEVTNVLSGQVSVVDCSPEEGGRLLGWINNGDSVRYADVHLDETPMTTFVARVASDGNAGTINVLVDGPDGPTLLTSCEVPGTGGWQNWVTVFCPLGKPRSGFPGGLTLAFKGAGDAYLFNLDWFGFAE